MTRINFLSSNYFFSEFEDPNTKISGKFGNWLFGGITGKKYEVKQITQDGTEVSPLSQPKNESRFSKFARVVLMISIIGPVIALFDKISFHLTHPNLYTNALPEKIRESNYTHILEKGKLPGEGYGHLKPHSIYLEVYQSHPGENPVLAFVKLDKDGKKAEVQSENVSLSDDGKISSPLVSNQQFEKVEDLLVTYKEFLRQSKNEPWKEWTLYPISTALTDEEMTKKITATLPPDITTNPRFKGVFPNFSKFEEKRDSTGNPQLYYDLREESLVLVIEDKNKAEQASRVNFENSKYIFSINKRVVLVSENFDEFLKMMQEFVDKDLD